MTIEILEIRPTIDTRTGQAIDRYADIIITQGGNSYLWGVGGLPPTGNVQAILDAREAELLQEAQARGKPVDLYEVTTKRVLKAFALVMLDELNILRQASVPPLPARTGAQLEAALRAKIKGLA